MMFSKRCEYAIRALIEMASSPASLHTIPKISKAQEIPPKFLEQILLTLRQAGLLTSRRGVGGGYSFAKPPSMIRVIDVLRAMDGDAFKMSPSRVRASSGSHPFDRFMADLEGMVVNKLTATTIEDLMMLGADRAHQHFEI
jgi:Rrf2 family protein